jgi:hypothetical protein
MRTARKAELENQFVMPGSENLLDAPERKGYVRRWVKHDPQNPGNVEMYQRYGYVFSKEEFVANTDVSEGAAMDSRVSRPAGKGCTYYLMEITKKRHAEIQAYKRKNNADITKAIGIPNSPNIYAPKFNGHEQLGVEEEPE